MPNNHFDAIDPADEAKTLRSYATAIPTDSTAIGKLQDELSSIAKFSNQSYIYNVYQDLNSFNTDGLGFPTLTLYDKGQLSDGSEDLALTVQQPGESGHSTFLAEGDAVNYTPDPDQTITPPASNHRDTPQDGSIPGLGSTTGGGNQDQGDGNGAPRQDPNGG